MTELGNIIFWIVYAVGMLAVAALGAITLVCTVWVIVELIKYWRAEDGK